MEDVQVEDISSAMQSLIVVGPGSTGILELWIGEPLHLDADVGVLLHVLGGLELRVVPDIPRLIFESSDLLDLGADAFVSLAFQGWRGMSAEVTSIVITVTICYCKKYVLERSFLTCFI